MTTVPFVIIAALAIALLGWIVQSARLAATKSKAYQSALREQVYERALREIVDAQFLTAKEARTIALYAICQWGAV